jgi:ABC-type protease/lipase transport system fused ATPase/permease subunit
MCNFFIILISGVVVTEACTELISKSGFFSFLREFLEERKDTNKVANFFNSAVSCPYCSSVWISFFITVCLFISCYIGSIKIGITGFFIFDMFLMWVFFHRAANYLHNFVDRWLDKYYK